MAKLMRDTAADSAAAYFAPFGAEDRFGVVTSPRGLSIQHKDDAGPDLVDLAAAQAAVNTFFASQAETMVFGVTRDSIGLGIGLIGPAPALVPAAPVQEGTDSEAV